MTENENENAIVSRVVSESENKSARVRDEGSLCSYKECVSESESENESTRVRDKGCRRAAAKSV